MKRVSASFFALLYYLTVSLPGFGQTAPADPEPPACNQLQQYFHQKTDDGQISGTVMLLAQGDDIWFDMYGKQYIEAGIPMAENTIFRLASMTKPIVSTAVMILIEQGKLSLDDPVQNYLPAMAGLRVLNQAGKTERLKRPVAIRDLLTHTGGFANNFFQNTPAEKAYCEAFKQKQPASLRELVDMLAELPLAHQPGEGWTYGYSTDILGRIVEVISGESIDRFLESRIFRPLKMDDTGFQAPGDKLTRFAAVYGKNLSPIDLPDAKSAFVNGKNFPRGAGGLVSTARDYLRFCRMLLNGGMLDGERLLKPETVRLMMQNHLPPGVLPHSPGMPPVCDGFGLGFGVQTGEPVFGSPGDCSWPGAYLTYFFIDSAHDGIGILMAQSTDFSNLPMLGVFHDLASDWFCSNGTKRGK